MVDLSAALVEKMALSESLLSRGNNQKSRCERFGDFGGMFNNFEAIVFYQSLYFDGFVRRGFNREESPFLECLSEGGFC